MRILLSVATIVLLAIAPAYTAPSSPVSLQLDSSAIVTNLDAGVICGGTFVQPDTVLSAAHCVRGGNTFIVYDIAGQRYQVRALVVSEPQDLSMLKLDQPSTAARPATVVDAVLGEEVWIVGAPAGELFLVTHGYISGIRSRQLYDGRRHKDPCTGEVSQSQIGTAFQQYLVLDARVYFGDSGGGVFDSAGNLVGVLVGMAAIGDCTVKYVLWGFAVGPEAIRAFLSGN